MVHHLEMTTRMNQIIMGSKPMQTFEPVSIERMKSIFKIISECEFLSPQKNINYELGN